MSVVETIRIGTVTLPEQHPRAAEGECVVNVFVIRHPDGPILVDTGPADDHPVVNELYRPVVTPIVEVLHRAGIDERELVAIVNTHLHFDHCGQNRSLPDVPVWVQAAELEAAAQPRFTVPAWAELAPARRRVANGDESIAEGVTLLATPGHTPGHQSVLVDIGGVRELIVGQACYTCVEYRAGRPADTDMHDAEWVATGRASLERLRDAAAVVARFSHDPAACMPPTG